MKSQILGLVLVVFFGPLGLLYSSPLAAILLVILWVLIAPLDPSMLLMTMVWMWGLSILISLFAVSHRNGKKRHEEMLLASANKSNVEYIVVQQPQQPQTKKGRYGNA